MTIEELRDALEHLADKTEQDEPYAVNTIELLREAADTVSNYEDEDLEDL